MNQGTEETALESLQRVHRVEGEELQQLLRDLKKQVGFQKIQITALEAEVKELREIVRGLLVGAVRTHEAAVSSSGAKRLLQGA
jgi:hypothetical protein